MPSSPRTDASQFLQRWSMLTKIIKQHVCVLHWRSVLCCVINNECVYLCIVLPGMIVHTLAIIYVLDISFTHRTVRDWSHKRTFASG